LALVLALALMSCDGPSRGSNTQPSAASGFLVTVTASPNVIPANNGNSVIQVKVFDRDGRLVDGATVTVSASPAISPQNVVTGTTTRGIFTTVYNTQNAQPGTVIVTATVEDAVATTTITVF
jgi:hypothetical protein